MKLSVSDTTFSVMSNLCNILNNFKKIFYHPNSVIYYYKYSMLGGQVMTVLFIDRRESLAQALTHIYKDLTFDLCLNDWADSYLDLIAQNHPRLVILEITRPE